jgi:hypothetical protein
MRLDTRRRERMDRIKGRVPRSDRRVHSTTMGMEDTRKKHGKKRDPKKRGSKST